MERSVYFWYFDGTARKAQQIADTGATNIGVILDSYHWYTAGGTVADIRALRAEDVVYVHVNDAPEGRALEALRGLGVHVALDACQVCARAKSLT